MDYATSRELLMELRMIRFVLGGQLFVSFLALVIWAEATWRRRTAEEVAK